MFEKMSSDGFLLRVAFLKLVFDFFFRRFGSAKWIRLEDETFPSEGVSCLVSSSSLSKSSSSSESVLVLVSPNSGFAVESWESDFFESIDEIVKFMVTCENFRRVLVARSAFEAS